MTATKTRKPRATKPKAAGPKEDVAKIVIEKIIEKLKEGEIVWQKTWAAGSSLPRSLSSGKLYRGINQFILTFAGYGSEWWGTYEQIAARGGQVRKGETHTKVIGPPFFIKKLEIDGETVFKKIFAPPRYFRVFNAEQADWEDAKRPPKTPAPQNEGERIANCEAIVAEYIARGPSLSHGGNSAHYVPSTDHVQLPPFESFVGPEEYYSTAFHELTHSTGNVKRWKPDGREGISAGTFGPFGSKVYSNEELVAELGAAILCGHAGIEQEATLDNSAAYIQHWIKVLEEDPKVLVTAAAQAQKAVDLILGTTFDNNNEGES